MQVLSDTLSIRTYSTKPASHWHDYHQLVLPLRGVIAIEVCGFNGKVAPGECVIVRQEQVHRFTADPQARFVVADMLQLPENIDSYQGVVFALKPVVSHYLAFVAAQLEQQVNTPLERSMYHTFFLLLSEQSLLPRLDSRIANAVHYIEQQLQAPLNLNVLAKTACLSSTQLKVLFKQQVGMSVMQYVTRVRIEKAQALLRHTDYPIARVGELVGYPELAAFSRKFSQVVGLAPSRFKR